MDVVCIHIFRKKNPKGPFMFRFFRLSVCVCVSLLLLLVAGILLYRSLGKASVCRVWKCSKLKLKILFFIDDLLLLDSSFLVCCHLNAKVDDIHGKGNRLVYQRMTN